MEEIIKRLEAIEKRLTEIEDREKIKQLHYRYINALAFTDWEEIIECFYEESSIDVNLGGLIKGKKEIEKFFKETLSQIHNGKEGIFMIHPIIYISGNTAKGKWLMYMFYSDHRTWQTRYFIQGIYEAEYIKIEGEWKFKHLKWRPRLEPPGSRPPAMMP